MGARPGPPGLRVLRAGKGETGGRGDGEEGKWSMGTDCVGYWQVEVVLRPWGFSCSWEDAG